MNTDSSSLIKLALIRTLMVTALMLAWGSGHSVIAAERRVTHSQTTSEGPCVMATDQAVADLFRTWDIALASRDPAKVAALYWPNAVLLPTVSNIPRADTTSIVEYFDHFLKKSPRGTIVRRMTQHYCGVSVDAGLYEFSVMDPAGNASTVSARYTFVYTYHDGTWKIEHHHSSAMPEPEGKTPKEGSNAAPEASPEISSETGSEAGRAAALRIQLESASRTPSSRLTTEQRRKVGRETVGLKVCAASQDGERSFEISDPAPYSEVNEAAIAWAKDAKWSVSGIPTAQTPACAQVIVRFEGAGL